ncbi:Uncharacterised protein [Shewanella morhuae]|uniref:Uncharacterized protein n=1 Tax=Shewanella morhuae TaxID=365591 RepID=A0A380A104_9GAMM|nr:Uncharacterised protein [Shewanella morhuae]
MLINNYRSTFGNLITFDKRAYFYLFYLLRIRCQS